MEGRDATESPLPITLREAVCGSRWGLEAMEMSGLERIRSAIERRLPESPCMRLSGLRPSEVGLGMASFAMPASPWWQLGTGVIAPGTLAFVADAAASGAVLSTLPPATACSPLDLKLNFIRPVKPSPNEITARGRVVHRGRTIAIVYCELSTEGKLVAIANQSVLVLPGRSWDKPVHVADEVPSDAGST